MPRGSAAADRQPEKIHFVKRKSAVFERKPPIELHKIHSISAVPADPGPAAAFFPVHARRKPKPADPG